MNINIDVFKQHISRFTTSIKLCDDCYRGYKSDEFVLRMQNKFQLFLENCKICGNKLAFDYLIQKLRSENENE